MVSRFPHLILQSVSYTHLEACRKARQAAEQEVATLESKGPMGLLYTIAGDKAKRLDEARQTLRKARADDQQASWDLAQAQVDLAQTCLLYTSRCV